MSSSGSAAGALTLREKGDEPDEAVDQHLAVTRQAEPGPEGAELVAQTVRPGAVEQRSEGLQVAAQPPQSDAQLAQRVR